MTRFILSSSKTHPTPSQNHRQMEWFSKRCLRHRQHWLSPHTRSSIRCHYTKSNPIDDHSNISSKCLQKQNFKPLGHYTCLQCGTSHLQKVQENILSRIILATYRKFTGVITPNQIPLTTIVTYLQNFYRSRISNHWATIPTCSVVSPILQKVQENILSRIILATYRKFTVAKPSDSHKMSVVIFSPIPYINKWQMSLCNNSSDNKSYWIHRVDVKVSAQVTTVTYMHQSQPSLHSLRKHWTVHLELWPGNHLIWCNATCTSNSDLAITWFGAMPPAPRTLTWQSLDLVQCHLHLELWPGNHLIWCNATCTSNSDLAITWFGAMPPAPRTLTWQSLDLVQCHHQSWAKERPTNRSPWYKMPSVAYLTRWT